MTFSGFALLLKMYYMPLSGHDRYLNQPWLSMPAMRLTSQMSAEPNWLECSVILPPRKEQTQASFPFPGCLGNMVIILNTTIGLVVFARIPGWPLTYSAFNLVFTFQLFVWVIWSNFLLPFIFAYRCSVFNSRRAHRTLDGRSPRWPWWAELKWVNHREMGKKIRWKAAVKPQPSSWYRVLARTAGKWTDRLGRQQRNS